MPAQAPDGPQAPETPKVPDASDQESGRTDWAVLTPITQVPHLAEAARRLGQTDRRIWVDKRVPPHIKTPNREPGQWLLSGERLPEIPELWEGFDR
jgi:hypothetical protein